MLKDRPSLHYWMRGSECLFHIFSPTHAHLAELVSRLIVCEPSIVLKRHHEAEVTIIWSLDHHAKVLPCHPMVGYDARSFYPWGSGGHAAVHAHWSLLHQEQARLYPEPWGFSAKSWLRQEPQYGLPTNDWPTRWPSGAWRACCMLAMHPKCTWACSTCPWIATTQTQPQSFSSATACSTATIATGSMIYGSAAGTSTATRYILWPVAHLQWSPSPGIMLGLDTAEHCMTLWPLPRLALISPGGDSLVCPAGIQQELLFLPVPGWQLHP